MTHHLVFDATDPKSPRFIELEDSTGHSINAGEWRQREDGYTELVLPAPSVWQDIATAPKTGCRQILGRESGPRILLLEPDDDVIVGFWNGFAWDDGDFNSSMDGFTHWMPLPSPPKPLSYEGAQL